MTRDPVADYYKNHHSGGTGFRRYAFTFGGEERIGWFKAHLPQRSGLRLLDIGCRDGTLTKHYTDGNEVVGIDVDDDALAAAREQCGIETHHLNLNANPLPFEDQSFDVVVAGEVLEHLQFPEVAVSEIHRVLRAGGSFLGSVPNAFRLPNRIRFLLGRDYETDPTHLHQFSPASLRTLLKQFQDIEIDYILGRRRRYHPRLLATAMAWRCRK